MGTTGGNNDDLIEANDLAAKGRIEPAVMVTHVGGIDSIAGCDPSTCPTIPGAEKKLTYTQFDMPLTAIEDFGKLGETDPLFQKLDEVCKRTGDCGAQRRSGYCSSTSAWSSNGVKVE